MFKSKNAKLWLLLLCIIFSGMCLCACNSDPFRINGNFEETIEVNSEYNDPGISCPDEYNIITQGFVNTNILGRYHIVYKVYTNDGELVKELSRYVSVVDTTAPTYIENTSTTYYAGFSYGINDFITYSDNYNNSADIQTNFTSKIFTSPGNHLVTIRIKDSSNNETVFSKSINVKFDIDRLVRNVYQNQLDKITISSPEGHGTMTRVAIDSASSFFYWDNGSIHFLKQVETSLGTSASIQISATEYGQFNNASIDYHINNNSQYSVGFANIDATQQYSSLTIARFKSTINNLNLNVDDMLEECNNSLLSVLTEFQNYMTNVLHLEVK